MGRTLRFIALATSAVLQFAGCSSENVARPVNTIIPASDEPVFEPSDRVLYSEAFEGFTTVSQVLTWNSAKLCYNYNNPSNWQFPSPSPAHGGSKAVRLNIAASSTYNDQGAVLECGMPSAPAGKFTVVEFWMRTKPGYPCRRANAPDREGAGEKTIIWNQGESSVPRFVLGCGLAPAGTWWGDKYDAAYPPSEIGLVLSLDGPTVGGTGTFWYFQNMNGAARDPIGYMNDGNYHLWKIKMTPGTFQNSTGGDGSIEIWIDGLKVVEYIGSDPSRPEYRQVLVPTTQAVRLLDLGGPFNGAPSPAQGDQWKDYDDLRIWVRP